MFCPKCGNEMADGSKFCMKCGAKVVRSGEKAGAEMDELAINKKKQSSKSILSYVFYFVSLIGLLMSNVASCIKYMKFGWIRNSAVGQVLREMSNLDSLIAHNKPEVFALGVMCMAIISLVLALIHGIFAKMKKALIFLVVGAILFLMAGEAWIHYIGFGISIVGTVGYMLTKKEIRV